MKFIGKLVKWNKIFLIPMLIVFFSMSTVFSAPDNTNFKKWCVDTFYDGSEIYEAYKVVNFDIESKTDSKAGFYDYWQKPLETLRLKTGDCEDFMFLFSHLLPWDYEEFDIVWGFVYDKTSIGKAKHVWGELTGKHGQIYIVEGGQADWDGIKKQEIVEKTEFRDPIIVMPQRTYTLLQGLFLEYDYFDDFTYTSIFGEGVPSSEAFEVLKMLHGMMTRDRINFSKN